MSAGVVMGAMREEHSGKSAKHFSVRNGLNTICYSDQRFRESLNRFGSDVELISLRYEAITAIMPLDEADCRERHVAAKEGDLYGRDHLDSGHS